MTKADIIDGIYGRVRHVSRKRAAEAVELLLEAVKTGLEKGDKVKIFAFGAFSVRAVGERTARNPQTGDALKLAPRKVVAFRPAQALKEAMNPHGD